MTDFESLIAAWPGAAVVTRYDRDTAAWMFIALHDSTLGAASGGTRMRVYPRPSDGLIDALRLAEGMTWKWATIALPHGGGKAVIALSRPLEKLEREGLLERYGDLVATLGGVFWTGIDLGTNTEDMSIVARRAPYVHGVARGDRPSIDAGPLTAQGVFAGIRAAVAHRFGSELRGRRVVVQGVGGVGGPLARLLAEAGADVLVSDVDPARATSLATEIGGTMLPADQALECVCDVFAPCAVGAVLSASSIPLLRCAIVAGSANNQLAEPGDAERLHQRSILYVPDYVINAGGALSFGLLARGASLAEVEPALSGLGRIVSEILTAAERGGESPVHAARRRAEAIIDEHRAAATRAG